MIEKYLFALAGTAIGILGSLLAVAFKAGQLTSRIERNCAAVREVQKDVTELKSDVAAIRGYLSGAEHRITPSI